jgi:hypothetical protein
MRKLCQEEGDIIGVMMENMVNKETIEQKQAMVTDWIKNISETQKVEKIPAGVLKEVLESYGANFENLSEENQKNLLMYAEKNRIQGMEAVWGEKFDNYQNWVNEAYIPDYENRTGKELPKMVNVFDSKNPERKASERKDMGMISFFGDLTGYASENLSFENFELLMKTRAENGMIRELPKEKRDGLKTKRILWDREVEPGTDLTTLKQKKDPETGDLIPIEMQLIRPASFPKEFPMVAWKKIQTL